MTVNSFKDFKKLLEICRAQGVKTVEVAGIKIELNDSVPLDKLTSKKQRISESNMEESLTNIDASIPVPAPEIATDSLTEEQMLFWSADAGGQTESDQQ